MTPARPTPDAQYAPANPAFAPIALRGVRGVIASRMMESLQATAQLTFHATVDAEPLVRARDAWRGQGIRVGYEDLVIDALRGPLARFPTFNALEIDGALVPQPAINVSCAIALASGLKAPTLVGVQVLSLQEIAEHRADLVERARSDRLGVKEMTGGTITVSNLGATRVEQFTPILNRPQQAILGLGRMVERAKFHPLGAMAGLDMGLSLTVDHRFHDGGPAGAFLTAICEAIEAGLTLP